MNCRGQTDWWRALFAPDEDPMNPSPVSEREEPFPEIVIDEEPCGGAAAHAGSSSLETLTPKKRNEISAALRKLPALDPSQRLLDRLGAVRRLRKPILSARRRDTRSRRSRTCSRRTASTSRPRPSGCICVEPGAGDGTGRRMHGERTYHSSSEAEFGGRWRSPASRRDGRTHWVQGCDSSLPKSRA